MSVQSLAMKISTTHVCSCKTVSGQGEVCRSLQHERCLGRAVGGCAPFPEALYRVSWPPPGASLHAVAALGMIHVVPGTEDCWRSSTLGLQPTPDL